MTSTLQTTTVRLLGATIDQLADPDPNEWSEVTDEERAAVKAEWERQADKVLAPYGCTMLGDGEIILLDINDDSVLEWDAEAVIEGLSELNPFEMLEALDKSKDVYVTPGHPTIAGAGYNCNCGQCLFGRQSDQGQEPEE